MVDEPKTIFQKIIDGEIPADIVYEDEHCLAFKDIAPQAPVHLLVIPRKQIRSLDQIEDEDQALMGHLMLVVQKLARQFEVSDGFRLISNCGEPAGQTVHHLHFHILGGRAQSWPAG